MLRMLRIILVVLALVLTLTACQPSSESEPAAEATAISDVEILWDVWGVPHIFAPDLEGLSYAHGWAQAKNHGDLLLRLLGRARGRAAEYWGEDELPSDRWVHQMGVPERAKHWYEEQPPAYRAALDAFAHGINEYAAAHGAQIADEVEVVLPVTAVDLLAHTQRSIHFTFIARPDWAANVGRRWAAGQLVAGVAQGRGVNEAARMGSNAWAVAPERSASGNALLVANPHLPWGDLFTWVEVQLKTPEVDVSGAALLGSPFVGIGWNDNVGWTHTVNTHDGVDVYELELAEGGYVFDGEVRPFETSTSTLRVRGEDGELREEELTVRRSVHGPVIAENAVAGEGGRALALRVVGLDRPGLFEQYWSMSRAASLDELEEAIRRMQMPMFTVIAADTHGEVMHLFGGLTPKRSVGDWLWDGVVPGISSETLWTEYHAYDELPRVEDPASGWLQNANDPPWTTTFPRALDPEKFPSYMAPRFMHFRAQSSARLLMDDESFTFEELVEAKHSTRMELAERILDDLEAAVTASGGELATEAWTLLDAWDHRADAASRGAVLFEAFAAELRRAGIDHAITWDPSAPLETPDGFADETAAVAALERAAAAVRERHGALDVPWGDVHRLRRGGYDLPANGGPGSLGIFRVVGYRDGRDGRRVAVQGDSYVAVIEFGKPLRAATLLSYGNASQPGSPHVGDQLELFSRQELRPVWRDRAEVEAHLEEHEILGDISGDTR